MMEIQSISIELPDLLAVYGFGSFFRRSDSQDCDLLVVVPDNHRDLGRLHATITREFRSLGHRLGKVFDLTILTMREHKGNHLREHNCLVPIFARCSETLSSKLFVDNRLPAPTRSDPSDYTP